MTVRTAESGTPFISGGQIRNPSYITNLSMDDTPITMTNAANILSAEGGIDQKETEVFDATKHARGSQIQKQLGNERHARSVEYEISQH